MCILLASFHIGFWDRIAFRCRTQPYTDFYIHRERDCEKSGVHWDASTQSERKKQQQRQPYNEHKNDVKIPEPKSFQHKKTKHTKTVKHRTKLTAYRKERNHTHRNTN